jgi:hypothetical protein
LLTDGTGKTENSQDIELVMRFITAIPKQGVVRVGNWRKVFVGSRGPAHRSYSPHQRVVPPGEITLSSAATVPTRALAKATRDRRVNNIFYWGYELWWARKRRKGGRGGRGVEEETARHVVGEFATLPPRLDLAHRVLSDPAICPTSGYAHDLNRGSISPTMSVSHGRPPELGLAVWSVGRTKVSLED